jgi:hypothetical protein
LLLASLLGLAAVPAFACYTVYDSANRVMYQGERPPVDMSLPLHEALQQRFPGGSMVFDQSEECRVISPVAMGNGGPVTRSSSPLLTNVGGKVAVVPPGDASMRTGVTVVPSSAPVASKSRGPHETVITEYRNPPVTVVRRGDEVIVGEVR